jgi:hypothetical protein
MTTWRRHARADLAHDLLLGTTPGGTHPRGWISQRQYPQPGSKHERVARIALARELRRGDQYFIGLVAAMIDPRTESSIIKQKIEFTPSKDRRRESKVLDRRDLDIAAFMHEWRTTHPGQSIESAVESAADHFGLAKRIIWGAWEIYKPILPSEEWKKIFTAGDR